MFKSNAVRSCVDAETDPVSIARKGRGFVDEVLTPCDTASSWSG